MVHEVGKKGVYLCEKFRERNLNFQDLKSRMIIKDTR